MTQMGTTGVLAGASRMLVKALLFICLCLCVYSIYMCEMLMCMTECFASSLYLIFFLLYCIICASTVTYSAIFYFIR